MKRKMEENKEVEGLFRTMQEKGEKYQKYFEALVRLPQKPPQKSAYARYGDSSQHPGEPENAELEPNLK